MSKKKTTVRKAVPDKISRAQRPDERIPVGGHRDKLTVRGLDPAYAYRWVEDENESGQRIFTFKTGGWDFAPTDGLRIGQSFVYSSDSIGSIARKPSGGMYMYLMRIPKELHEQDQKDKQKRITEDEKQMLRPRDVENDDGQYGGGSLKRG